MLQGELVPVIQYSAYQLHFTIFKEKYKSVLFDMQSKKLHAPTICNSCIRTLPQHCVSAGVNSPRVAANGQDLPSARRISSQFATEADIPYENYTLLIMQWGQFLDHDLTHTPISRGKQYWSTLDYEFERGYDFTGEVQVCVCDREKNALDQSAVVSCA